MEFNNEKKKLSRQSSSFRLRSPSLNALRLHRVFDLFDKNNDGFITVEELSQALSRLGLEADFSDLKSTVDSFIKPDKTGLRFDDFAALHKTLDESFFGGEGSCCDGQARPVHKAAKACALGSNNSYTLKNALGLHKPKTGPGDGSPESDLEEAFNVFDEDGDGFISAVELQKVLKKLGLPEAGEMEQVEKMIVSVDSNHDGRVDFFEFKNMMQTVVVPSS